MRTTSAAFSARIVSALNATAPLGARRTADRSANGNRARRGRSAGLAPPRRPGQHLRFTARSGRIFDFWFGWPESAASGIPFAYETLLNAEFLPFERPFALAHEWGHVAGFGDESDANLIAALTTLRSQDAFIRYSGLFWAYGFLPDADRRALRVSPLVRADLAAARRRFCAPTTRGYPPLQWYVYDKYLRATACPPASSAIRCSSKCWSDTPLDGAGLPVAARSARPNGRQPRTEPLPGWPSTQAPYSPVGLRLERRLPSLPSIRAPHFLACHHLERRTNACSETGGARGRRTRDGVAARR